MLPYLAATLSVAGGHSGWAGYSLVVPLVLMVVLIVLRKRGGR